MKIGTKRMFQLMLREIDSIKIKGKSLYIEEDEYGCDFIYGGKKLDVNISSRLYFYAKIAVCSE